MRRVLSSILAMALTTPILAQLQPTIAPRVRVDTGGVLAGNETSAVATTVGGEHAVLAWNDWRQSPQVSTEFINMAVALSNDGGATWSDFLLRPPALNQSSVEGDPFTAVDARTGTIWAGAISFTAGINGGVYVARLNPGAPSFEPSVMARVASNTDKPWMVAGPPPGAPMQTRCYIAFNQGVMRSLDMGDSWTTPVPLGGGIGFMPRLGSDGALYVSSWSLGPTMELHRSLNGGESFTSHDIVDRMDVWSVTDHSRYPGTFRAPAWGVLAADAASGQLYFVYSDTTAIVGGNFELDLYLTTSCDQGETWSPAVAIIDASGDQLFGWIEVDHVGRLHLVYLDGRHVPGDDDDVDGWYDVYYAFSVNGGAAWTERRLTPASFNCNDDGLDRPIQFLGDYFGMGISEDAAFPVYLDSSSGDPDIYTHRIELPLRGDVNGDGLVTFADLLLILTDWGPCASAPCPEDVDGSGNIDAADILIVLVEWSAT